MTPVRSVKNQYLGINAHLHSFWQAEHKWNRFHNAYIVALVQALKAQLLPLGYSADIEESLQIRRIGDDLPRSPRADILMYSVETRSASQQASTAPYPVQPILLDELVEPEEDYEHPYAAIILFERASERRGEPVGWIELLSPSNKGENKDAYTYLAKRRMLLEQGLVFVEVDFLHETAPTFERLPDYSRHESGAVPYRIMVMDPRPDYHRTQVFPYPFAVDVPIPTAVIPLLQKDQLVFDFNRPYQALFEQMLYGIEDVDYRQMPLNFDRYSPADQARIANRMIAVLWAQQAGQDLEQAPLPVENLPLDEALLAIERLQPS